MRFQSVEPKPDFPKMEREILESWYKSGVVDKYLHKNKKAKKTFSFMDGPITANNPMGVHHAWGRTYKDLWQRYKNMQGFANRFQNGFDCQGLWVEVEVEKELGFKTKKEIEKFGIAKFVNLCKARVEKFAKIQTEQSKRLGYFVDWDNSYFTMSDENNYMIWHFLKKCWEKGWLYKGKDSVPWCPRCGTAISQHEMLTEDYKLVTHKSIYFKLPIKNKGWENTSFLVWTTTPWTIPANVALAVDPKKDYLLVKENNEKLVILKNRADVLFTGLKKQDYQLIKGRKLVNLTYQAPFDHLPRVKKALIDYQHRVIASDPLILPVEENEGTGIIHLATGSGSEDYKIGKKEKLPVIDVIDEEAKYLKGMLEFSSKNAKKNPELILDFIKNKEKGRYFYRSEKIKHRYPCCWRCKEELVWRAVDEWYIKMDKIDPEDKKKRTLRQKMIDVAKQINWIPAFGLKREIDWLTNMDDWLISKKRYWGLALPIWECQCGHFEVIGSKKELKKRAVKGWQEFSKHSPHRPWIDKVKIRCPKCKTMGSRILDVGNPWLDAGIVSFSTLIDPKTKKLSYTSDKKYFKRWFPADFITESFPGQFKNWFYSMIAMSTVLEDKVPYKTVLGFGTLLGEDGRAMHKSWGNAIEFNEGADKIGVDVMRWMYLTHNPEKNLLFGYKVADKTRSRFHLILWNTYKFFTIFGNLHNWSRKKKTPLKQHVLDKWILARLNFLLVKVTEYLDNYNPYQSALLIEEFVQDLSTWYVRRSRERVSLINKNKKDKNACLFVLDHVLVTLSQILAPFNPFISEIVYKNLTGQESVHLSSWPKGQALNNEDEQILEKMRFVRQICELGHSQRKKLNIKVRQPLQSIEVKCQGKKLDQELIELIKAELNIKKVIFKKGKKLKVKLNTVITPDLENEGEAREIIRQIQNARKKSNCKLDQLVNVYLPSWPKEFAEEIKTKTLAKELKKGKKLKISNL
jgi:isoleucyl-tRNA synthetase